AEVFYMQLLLQKEVLQRLPQGYTQFILTLNDGSNPFSNAMGCCLIGERFLIVATKQQIEPFTIPVDSSDLTFYTSEYDLMFLTGKLVLFVDPNSQNVMLKNESGLLDLNVEIKSLVD